MAAARKDQETEFSMVVQNVEPESPKIPETDIVYKVEDVPPWYLCVVLGFQHYITMFSGAVAIPYLISTELCIGPGDPASGYIISTTLFVSGIASFIQATFGNRLPIIQGPSLSFLIPVLAILSEERWICPDKKALMSNQIMTNETRNATDEEWKSRMREVSGAIVVASCVEVLVGLTGLMGLLMRWITPLAIAPTITLIGLSLFLEAAKKASDHWGIAIMTMVLLIIFSQYLSNVQAPRCAYKRDRGWHMEWFPFFKLFPVMLTILLSWGFCAILTTTSVLEEKSKARTDLNLASLENAEWFRVPYPGQWGMPTISVGPVLGVLAGVLASTVESVGDYYACARLAGAPPPPVHAINRGIFMEGVGCVLAGFSGTGSGLTSFSQNVGAIGITKVGSRRVVQYAAVMISLFGLIGKFGALFIMIPSPIMGGIFCVMFAIITGVGLSNLQFINLNSSRNLFVLGFSIFMGLCIPTWLHENPKAIDTGSIFADQILSILLKTSMFVGGFLGCLLDNTIPGTEEERGITKWKAETSSSGYDKASVAACYDMPFGMKILRALKCFAYLPISPTYEGGVIFQRFKNLIKWGKPSKKSKMEFKLSKY